MPQLGETVTEGTITRWAKQVGEPVAEDEVLFEVSTDKVDSEVPSPVSGVLTEILVPEGETVDVSATLAVVSSDGAGAKAAAPAEAPAEPAQPAEAEKAPEPPAAAAPAAAPPPAPAPAPTPAPAPAPAPVAPAATPAPADDAPLVSPIVRRLAAEHDLDLSFVTGTGVGGRITRGDVERAVQA